MFTLPTTAQQLPHPRSLVPSMLSTRRLWSISRVSVDKTRSYPNTCTPQLQPAAHMAISDPEVICIMAFTRLILVRWIRRPADPDLEESQAYRWSDWEGMNDVIQSIDSGILFYVSMKCHVQKRTRHIMWKPVIHGLVKLKDLQGEGGGVCEK
jgi:hypothetical protein